MDWTHRLRLRHLQLLLSVADTRNLSRSAAALNTTQPALSKWLKELQEDIGLPLFERHARGLRPTAYGEALIEHARRIEGHLDSARDDMAALRAGGSGLVAIGTSGVSAADTVPLAVARLLRVLPRAQVRLVESTMNLMLPQLVRGELDVVVGRAASEDPDSRLQCETLYREPINFVAGVRHPLVMRSQRAAPGSTRAGIVGIARTDAGRTGTTTRNGAATARAARTTGESRAVHAPRATHIPRVTDATCVRARELDWDDLFRYPWIVWPQGTPVRNALELALTAAGKTMPREVVESNSSILNVTLLGHSELLGVASHRAALRFARMGALRILPMRLEGSGSVSMYWRADSINRTAVALMLEHLRACAREERGRERE